MPNSVEKFLYNRNLSKNSDFNMWYSFPGPESFVMSSLGYLWLFKAIDEMPDINVERVYSDTKTTKILSSNVDIIGFSFTFVLNISIITGRYLYCYLYFCRLSTLLGS